MTKTITVITSPPTSLSVTEQSEVDSVEVNQTPLNDETVVGTRADLVEAKTTGPQGPPGIGTSVSLPTWSAALAKRNSRRANVVLLGASVAEGFPVEDYDMTIGQRLVSYLRAQFPTPGVAGGRGFVGVPTASVTLNTPITVNGGAIDPAGTGLDSVFYLGANHSCWYTNGTGTISYTAGPNATSVDIHYGRSNAGGATAGAYQVNSGSITTFNTYNDTVILDSVRVEVSPGDVVTVSHSGAGYIIVLGFQEYGGDETAGIQVHNTGHSGYTAAKWSAGATTPGGWRESLALLNPDLLVISDMGANDSGSRSSAQFQLDIAAFIIAIRDGASPLDTVPILLVGDYDLTAGISMVSPWSEYIDAMRVIANKDDTISFLDISQLMPPTAGNPLGIYAPDLVHGNADGSAYELMARYIFKEIAPQGPAGSGSSGGGVGFDGSGHLIRYIGDTEPDSSGWDVNDLWLDTSTE